MASVPSSPRLVIAPRLLRWYDAHRRAMPWRAKKGHAPNPYHVLLSEFMLQQTGVSTVIPYFLKFIRRWPSLKAFARADLEEVRAQWAGLGYYRRARFLHQCARAVMTDHAGALPADEESLLALPGIGAYTAAAVAAIAFDKRANVVDGNVERVVARLFASKGKKDALRELAATLVPKTRNGDYAQALMDLGATVCTPRKPACERCPLKTACRAFALGKMEEYPLRAAKKAVPQKYAAVYVIRDTKGRVLLRKRPEEGLYAGLWEFPSTPWTPKLPSARDIQTHAPGGVNGAETKMQIQHVFSHFRLTLSLRLGHSGAAFFSDTGRRGEYRWIKPAEFPKLGMPSVMKKVWQAAERHDPSPLSKAA